MNKFLVAAIVTAGVGLMSSAADAASQLTVATYYNIPFYDYYPTSATIDSEVAYANSVAPDATSIADLNPSFFSASLGGFTAMNFSGSLNIATAGYYSFHVDADDAARISLDGTSIAESNFYGDGLDLPNSVSLYLTAGAHAYDAFTFQEVGGQNFDTYIGGPDVTSFSAQAPAAAAVPEPASWAMMVGGFGLLGAAMRHKKATISFA